MKAAFFDERLRERIVRGVRKDASYTVNLLERNNKYDMIILFTYDLRMKAYLEFAALYISPLFVLLYFWKSDYDSRKVYRKADSLMYEKKVAMKAVRMD